MCLNEVYISSELKFSCNIIKYLAFVLLFFIFYFYKNKSFSNSLINISWLNSRAIVIASNTFGLVPLDNKFEHVYEKSRD